MRPHPRIRKTIKWCGAILCVLLAALWAWSTQAPWSAAIVPGHMVELSNAGVHIASQEPATAIAPALQGYYTLLETREYSRPLKPVWDLRTQGGAQTWGVFVPLWIPLAPCMAATALAWLMDLRARRRATLGLCPKCSYSRAGLAPSAPCPECGAAAPVTRNCAKRAT